MDPSADMPDIAQSYVAALGLAGRTQLANGVVDDLPDGLHDAATSIFVIHFVLNGAALT
jgi:hypothetical protein